LQTRRRRRDDGSAEIGKIRMISCNDQPDDRPAIRHIGIDG
jgi:hypothetical protein